MAEPTDSTDSTVMDPVDEKTVSEEVQEVHESSSSSSSSSDSESEKPASPSSVKPKVFRLFGRERPVHQVLGGGKPADMFLWKNKKISASALGGATAAYIFFEVLEYHLLTLLCHILILLLSVLFLWSNVTYFIHKSKPRIPEIHFPEEPFREVASALVYQINWGLSVLRSIASGKDLKKFLIVIAGFWVLSIVGNWCNFLTLFYLSFVLLHTVPVLYEKYDEKIDSFAEKASIEIKRQYAVLDAKVLSKIPKGPLKDKKTA